MSPEAVSRLSPDQITCLLSDGNDPPAQHAKSSGLSKARRDIFDAVCARFNLTTLHLLAQPIETTKAQILEIRPELRSHANPFYDLVTALKEYGQ